MKAVILAAGKSTWTYPLTISKPKPLLKVANRSLIEHNLEQIADIVDEVIIIIGYKGNMIKKHLGSRVGEISIKYVEQKTQLGTAHALMQARKFIKKEKFIVMMADDMYFRSDIRRCIKYELAVMAKRVEDYSNFGVFIRKENKLLDLVEKPKEFVSDLANTAFYVFNEKIFDCIQRIGKSERGEYELTEALKYLAKNENIFCVECTAWFPIAYPWDLLKADQVLRYDEVLKGKNSVIKGQAYNCSIGNNCIIDGLVKNSIIGDNVQIEKNSIVEDSIIGDNVIFSGAIASAEKIKVWINDREVEVENFGAVIGNNSKLKNVKLNAGTLVWPSVSKKNCMIAGISKK